ncbi:MAG TPA: sulfite exporter TauE/SafE family protein [Bdellovibrionota bacterium]|jgi:hypothetical protein
MFPEHYLYIALNFCLGACVAAYGTLVGAGGGFLLVPVFLLGFNLPHQIAVGTSLVVVMVNAFSGTLGYVRDKRIDYRLGLIFSLCTLPGAVIGGFTTAWVSSSIFSKIFGLLLSLTALYLLLRGSRKSRPPIRGKREWGWVKREIATRHGMEQYEVNEPLGGLFSLFVGAISSWFGIGGGIIHVPLMTEVLRIPVHVAVGTSHFILGITALVGVLVHFYQGHVNVPLALQIGAGALLGAQLGVRLSRRVHGSLVIRALSLALLAVGLRLLLGS